LLKHKLPLLRRHLLLRKARSSLGPMPMIRTMMYLMDMAVTTMAAATTVMVAVMREEAGIGTTIRMDVTRNVVTTVGQIALGEVGVVVADAASLLLL
jgi:hypothetical protein